MNIDDLIQQCPFGHSVCQQGDVGYAYLSTCTPTGERYVGAHRSSDVDSMYVGSGKNLTARLRKYGRNAFTLRVLRWASSVDELAKLEYWWIVALNAADDPSFLNIVTSSLATDKRLMELTDYRDAGARRVKPERVVDVTNNNYGHHWPAERRQALSVLRKANGRTAGELNGMYGKRDDAAVNGQHMCMRSADGKLLRVFATKTLAMRYLGIRGHSQFNRAVANRLMFKGYLWTQNDEDVQHVAPAVTLNDVKERD